MDETVDKLKTILQSKGVTLFALVDHSGEAEKVGLKMPPTKLLIFGNPKGGTPLMLAAPSAAIDLPLKILVAEDTPGKSVDLVQQRRVSERAARLAAGSCAQYRRCQALAAWPHSRELAPSALRRRFNQQIALGGEQRIIQRCPVVLLGALLLSGKIGSHCS